MIDQELLEILVCPDTRKTLKMADKSVIERVNSLIEKQMIKNKAGLKVNEKIQDGLVVSDGSRLYPIREDIPILLPEEAIMLDQLN